MKDSVQRTLHAHLLVPPTDEALDFLRSKLTENIVLTIGDELSSTHEAHILVGGRPTREQLKACLSLQSLIIPFAGIPQSTRELLHDFPSISVHNLHYNAAATAEMAVALMLAAAKFLLPADRMLRRHDWTFRYQPNPSMTLDGKTVLVLGFGAIGRRIARACHGLGMNVIAIRRQAGRLEGIDFPVELYGNEKLVDLLPRAEILQIALPATPETESLIGMEELAHMPPGSILVNVGRGSIVDQRALYDALVEGHLAAAGLDVWYNYPSDEKSRGNTPPADVPFHELENVVMSPHRGGGGRDGNIQRMLHLAELLNAAASGETMPNRVDIRSGY